MPKVSIIIPNYNHARFLDNRIQSVLNQSYQDFEVIYLDDASIDNSADVFAKYATDPRIRTVCNQINSGSPFRQWNKGVREAQGKYIWIAESDDYADVHLLEALVTRLEENQSIGVTYCQSWTVNEHDVLIQNLKEWTSDLDTLRWQNDFTNCGVDECRNYLIIKNIIPNASAVVFRKTVYEQVHGADESFLACGDWLLWAKMLLQSDVAFVAEPLNFFRQHSASVTKKSQRSLLEDIESYRVLEYILQNVSVPTNVIKIACTRRRDCWINKLSLRHIFRTWNQHIEVFRIARRIDKGIGPYLVWQTGFRLVKCALKFINPRK